MRRQGVLGILVLSSILLSGLLWSGGDAFSRERRFSKGKKTQDGRPIRYKRKTVLRFDDSLIMGDVKNPREFYFVHRPEKKFKGLLKRRKNFHKEMLRDAVMIR